jgi:hypothetical protein
MTKVFLSHATDDKELVDAIETLIEQGIGIAHDEIFCSSLEGMGIPTGSPDFKEYIREKMNECDTVVAVISENFYASPFSMCELGAVWVLAKNFFPILVPPVDFKDLRGALTGMQCVKLEEPSTASKLYDHLSKLVDKPVGVARWDSRKTVFYNNLPSVLKNMRKPGTVTPAAYKEIEKQRDEAKALNVELQEDADKKAAQIKKLAAAKDAKEVAAIQREFSSEIEQYEQLLSECKRTLRKIPRIVQEALYYEMRGDDFIDAHLWDEFNRAKEDEQLEECKFRDGFVANSARPAIAEAKESLSNLRDFLSEISHDGYDLIAKDLGDTPDLRRRSYWMVNDLFF